MKPSKVLESGHLEDEGVKGRILLIKTLHIMELTIVVFRVVTPRGLVATSVSERRITSVTSP
jgi:hypothetical protein